MISVLIPTLNEALDLAGCLQSVSWSDDIHVYDSGSTDATVEIAQAYRARVTLSPYANRPGIFAADEAAHKAWALNNLPFKYRWVFHIDADERCSPELAENMRTAVAAGTDRVAYRVQRRDFLHGRWLKHVQATAFYIRLFQPGRIHYKRLINPLTVVDGPVGKVTGYLDHYPFSKGLAAWLAKHNAYSTLEAQQAINDEAAGQKLSLGTALLGRQPEARRFHQKLAISRIPGRPILKFFVLYVLKGGWLDGAPGFEYAMLQAIYEYWIVLKVREASSTRGRV